MTAASCSAGTSTATLRASCSTAYTQTFVTPIEAGIESARALAGGRDIEVMGGGVTTAALRAGLLDEVILHQVPVLLGHGRRFFQDLPAHIGLSLVEAVPAPGVTHLRYQVEK